MAERGTNFYLGEYYLGSLSQESAASALRVIDMPEVVNLRNCIYNLPKHTILQLKYEASEYLKGYKTLHGFVNRFRDSAPLGELRPAQTVGVAYMFYVGSALLGDEVGVGKTVQVAGLWRCWEKRYQDKGKPKPFRALFLAEKSSAGQIQDKLIQFTGDYVDLIESGNKVDIEKYFKRNPAGQGYSHNVVATHAAILNPEFLSRVYKEPFDMIIFDESSALKSSTTDLFKAVRTLCKKTERRILLNATVFETELRDIYNQLLLVDEFLLPPVSEFERYFTTKKPGRFGGFEKKGYKNEEIFKKAISLRYLARTRTDTGAKKEQNNIKIVFLKQSPEQRFLAKKTSLYDILWNYPTLIKQDIEFDEYTTPKLKAVLHIAESVHNADGQLFIYCNFIEAQNALAEKLRDKGYRVAVLNGRRSSGGAKVRTQICDDFNRGEYDILIANVIRGLDLTSCDNCILYTVDSNPARITQVEGRITREFDVIGKNVWMLVMMGKEKQRVEKVLKLRIEESHSLAHQGQSLIASSVAEGVNFELCELFEEFGEDED